MRDDYTRHENWPRSKQAIEYGAFAILAAVFMFVLWVSAMWGWIEGLNWLGRAW